MADALRDAARALQDKAEVSEDGETVTIRLAELTRDQCKALERVHRSGEATHLGKAIQNERQRR